MKKMITFSPIYIAKQIIFSEKNLIYQIKCQMKTNFLFTKFIFLDFINVYLLIKSLIQNQYASGILILNSLRFPLLDFFCGGHQKFCIL